MRRFGAIAALAALAGCSVVNDPGRHRGEGGEPVPLDEFCGELAQLACEARQGCCSTGLPGPFEDCVAGGRAACEADLVPLLSDPRVGYDPARAGEVVAEGRALIDRCDTSIAEWYVFDVISVMQGTAVAGTNCTPNPSAEEDPAAFFSCSQQMNQVCRPEVTAWECQDISREDGACAIIYHCERGLYCELDLFTGTCQDQRPVGSDCTDGAQCESLFCSEETGRCVSPGQDIYCVPLDAFYGE